MIKGRIDSYDYEEKRGDDGVCFLTVTNIAKTWSTTLREDTSIFQMIRAVGMESESARSFFGACFSMMYLSATTIPDNEMMDDFARMTMKRRDRYAMEVGEETEETEEEILAQEQIKQKFIEDGKEREG